MNRSCLIRVSSISLLLAGCGSTTRPSVMVPQGTWGGDHVALVLDATHGELEFDCAHGSLAAPIPVDSTGAFQATGIFVREHGGPIREGEIPDQHPAGYVGTLDGKRMTLTVTLSDESQQLGPFELVLGGSPHVLKCL